MKVISYSEIGCVRKNNEDSLLILPEYGVYVVADGMGGHLAGEVASQTAIKQFENKAPEIKNLPNDQLEPWIKDVLISANREVYQSSNQNPANEGMGTTLTALVIREDVAVLGHVGDSRAYLWRDNSLDLLTVDHSLTEELLRLGQISPEEAVSHPQRHVLVRAIGASWDIEVDSQLINWKKGDVFFLCTDGFSNQISDSELKEEFLQSFTWEEKMQRLRRIVLERGAPDNFTAICCITE